MTFDLARILESKRAYRRQLAARPIAEKMAMLDALRERALAIRQADRPETQSGDVFHEKSGSYRTGGKGGQAS
jgi:hypothetical protein